MTHRYIVHDKMLIIRVLIKYRLVRFTLFLLRFFDLLLFIGVVGGASRRVVRGGRGVVGGGRGVRGRGGGVRRGGGGILR